MYTKHGQLVRQKLNSTEQGHLDKTNNLGMFFNLWLHPIEKELSRQFVISPRSS